MKDSGVVWIGEIPQGWSVRRGKDIFAKRSLAAFETDEIVTCFRDGQVTLRKNRREEGFTIALKEHGYQGVRVGDLVVHAMDAFAGAIGISESNGKCSPVYSICRARQISKTDLRFYSYVLRDMALNGYIQSVGQGIRERSTDFRFREVEVTFYCQPTLAEQRAIADYLDRQTALIDQRLSTLAEKKTVLAELRKATIHEAVTKGSTWNAETGQVEGLPNGWEASQAKRLLRFITSGSRGWAEYYADEGDIFLRIGNLTRETIELDLSDVQHIRLPANATEGSRTRIMEGDMLVSITADLGLIAVAPKLDKPAYVNQHIALCRPKKMVNPRWLGYAMVSLQSKRQMLNSGYGGTKIQLSLDDVRHVWLAVPPPDEQKRIADHLDQRTQQFDAQLATLDKQAQVLKELRKAIIHEAVTGKIDLSGPSTDVNQTVSEWNVEIPSLEKE